MSELQSEKRRKKTPAFHYAKGMNPSQARTWLKFYFGKYYYDLRVSQDDREFHIRLYKEINGVEITEVPTINLVAFAQYWGPTYNLIFMNDEKIEFE